MDDACAVTKDETLELWKEGKSSIDCLREAKPSANISIRNDTKNLIPENQDDISKTNTIATKNVPVEQSTLVQISKISETIENVVIDQKSAYKSPESQKNDESTLEKPTSIETVFEKLDVTTKKIDSTTDSSILGQEKNSTDMKGTSSGTKSQLEISSQTKIPVLPLTFENRPRMPKPDRDVTSLGAIDTKSANLEIKAPTSEPKGNISNLDEIEIRQTTSSIYSVKGTPSARINRKRDSTSTVFPVGCMGCKDEILLEGKSSPRRFLDATEAAADFVGHINSTPRKRSSTGRQEIDRNPVTGVGIVVESRRQIIKRKDGNPLLGTGYENSDTATAPSSSRIPPGGYSQGLW